ncbi:hypothetical protein [Glaciibacter superstes]|nr:hypothetical protein [Glaciibacter superstes]
MSADVSPAIVVPSGPMYSPNPDNLRVSTQVIAFEFKADADGGNH